VYGCRDSSCIRTVVRQPQRPAKQVEPEDLAASLNPSIPERREAEQPDPSPTPGWVVLGQAAEEQTAEQRAAQADVERVARVWARVTIERLSRAQAAIDWSKDAGTQLMAAVRSNQELLNWLLLAAILRVWIGWWWN
jgi:hypothetical protein